MPEGMLLGEAARSSSVFWGILVPSLIFLISFVVTYALYRKFAPKEPRSDEGEHLRPHVKP
jgi:uncharacterized membrane protein (DUF485 family)